MRSFVLSIVLASLLLVSCNSKGGFTIKGSVSGFEDDSQVILYTLVDNMTVPMDSARLSGGKFVMKGTVDTCDVAIIAIESEDREGVCSFFLEKGTIKIGYDGDRDVQHIGGTKVNNSFQKFYEKVQALNDKASEIQDRIQINQAVNQEVQSFYDQMQDLQDKYVELVKSSIIDNCDNAFGFHQLMDTYDLFEPDEIDGFIRALYPKFGGNEDLNSLAELIEVQLATSEGRQFIDFELPILKEGETEGTARLSDYAGKKKVVLLDFWASWCEPCRRAIPGLKEVYAKYSQMGFEIVSVSVDTNYESWKEAVAEDGMPWPQLIDSSNGDEESPASKYAVMAIPSTFLIDADGTIIGRNLMVDELDDALRDIFANSSH